MRKFIDVNPDKCTGCRICEAMCSFFHTRQFNPRRSRITILKKEEKAIDVPTLCQHCEKPYCAEVCPTAAISRNVETGAMLIDYDKCMGCRLCVTACPFGGVTVDLVSNNVIKCDFCDGDPQCVKYCPQNALEYLAADRIGLEKRRAGARKIAKLMESIILEEGSD